ncbi:pilus assembly protein [Spiribacter halobius]|nr:PilC/PilY family type IV pilus protein [Spiribacter halobius]UEX78906.1 hypothetical protein LMH63_04485 [Spiribacter halobius]
MTLGSNRLATAASRRALWVAVFGACALSPAALAQLDISQNALEALTPVEPNVVVLNDDSGSMDWEVMTTDVGAEFLFSGTQPDGTSPADAGDPVHRDADNDGNPDCTFASNGRPGYLYIAEFASNTYGDNGLDCNTADDDSWRARNSDFNRLYFNPQQTYTPWAGVDADGDAFTDIDATNAPDDPYDPADYKDLTSEGSGWDGGTSHQALTGGFRFFTWSDDDGDGLFDNGEERKYEIGSLSATDLADLNAWLQNRYAADAKQYASTDEIQQNFANWFSYYRSREFAAKAGLSRTIRDNTSARIGYATINNNSNNRIPVATMNVSPSSGNKRSLLDQLYETRSASGTPLRENLQEIGRYFACESNSIFGDAICPQTQDEDGNNESGAACRQNYAILMTDGYYNGNDPSVGNADGDNDSDFDGGAFEDGLSNTLADVAMYYYERDLHDTLTDLVPTTARDRNLFRGSDELGEVMHQHMATYTIGFGVNGTLDEMPGGPDDPDTKFWPGTSGDGRIDDLRHAAFNGRGSYLSARDPDELATSLEEIFSEIAAGVGAGSAVAFNTQNIRSDSLVFRAFYDTKTNTGDLIAQQVNDDGTLGSTAWRAAEQLDGRTSESSDTRRIVTYDPDALSGIAFDWSSLTTDQQGALHVPVPPALTTARQDNGGVGDERLGWVRGHSVDEGIAIDEGELREREVNEGRLGDITHSSPVFVGRPPFSGRNGGAWPASSGDTYPEFQEANASRDGVVYVGANDGMLHAFSTDTGEELFAYVPSILIDDLPDLASPEYNHRFFVDASPQVNDVFMGGSWQTTLIGGLGAGGRGYFALDITDPSDFTTETGAAGQVLWEFVGGTGAEADDASLGLTFSEPVIAMSNDEASGEKRWVAIFGNGYNSDDPNGNASLFVLFLDGGTDGVWTEGTDYFRLDTGIGFDDYNSATMPHLTSTTPNGIGDIRAIDYDGNGTVDVVYAGDLQGNLHRFDLSSSNTNQWDLDGTLFQASYADGSGDRQPITKAPVAVRHPDGGLVLVQGTGSWMTNADATSDEIQSIYGIWDDDPLGNLNAVTHSELIEQQFINEVDPVNGFVVRTLTNNEVDWSTDMGWYIDLDAPAAGSSTGSPEFPGERAVRNMQLRGGIAFVNTVIPKVDAACGTIVGGFELGFDPLTGSTPEVVVFDTNGDGVFDVNDNVGGLEGQLNRVTGLRFEGGVPTDSGFIENFRVTQVGDEVRSMGTNTGGTGPVGRRSWREVIPSL